MNKLVPLQIQMFNDKVRVMNQTQSRELILTAQEARNLHNDIFALLTRIAELESARSAPHLTGSTNPSAKFDGGSF
jgi:hypothetical protein